MRRFLRSAFVVLLIPALGGCQLFQGLGLGYFENPAQDLASLVPFPHAIVFPVLAYPIPTILGFSYATILKPSSHVTPLDHSAHGFHF